MNFTEFEEKLGYSFKDKSLLELALTHSSFANENKLKKNNERFEFLGDSVLGFVTAEYLFTEFKNRPEGEMTKLRAAVVCEKSLFKFAEQINLGKYILLGRGEDSTGGRNRPSVVSDAFEAIIAAIYIDGGMEAVKPYILRFIKDAVKRETSFKDNKSLLQEEIQKVKGNSLAYEEVGEEGPDHDKTFVFRVKLNGEIIGEGKGKSKKEAEQNAAGNALNKLHDEAL
ncbi:MAG: ribonuclease III [Clostridia bacterium]|jgi:ribonuclease-3|nr:ribonuclease III [Clostridia bacterium]